MRSFKVLLVGDGGVGKSTWVTRHKTGEFEPRYNATTGVQLNRLSFHTSVGEIVLNVWDVAGQERYSGQGSSYYANADACVLMFDLTSKITYKSIPSLYRDVRAAVCSGCVAIPMVLCGNKYDCSDPKILPESITFHRTHQLQYFDISAKSQYNFEKPFLSLIRQLLKDESIHFVEAPAVRPPEALPSIERVQELIQSIPEFMEETGLFNVVNFDPTTSVCEFKTSDGSTYHLDLTLKKLRR